MWAASNLALGSTTGRGLRGGAGGGGEMFFHATLARTFIQSLRLRGDDDFVDRLNYYYTPIMLAVACLIISAKQYGGTPIECWVNPHSRESMEEYIESYCWIQNTYWVPLFENIPDDLTAREKRQIGYYQWVPFILIAEALMFSLPCIIWRLLNWQTGDFSIDQGLNLQHLISTSCDAQAIVDQEDRLKAVESVAQSLIDILDLQSPIIPHSSRRSMLSRIRCDAFNGHYATGLYLFTKLCYTLNIVLQFLLLNAALKSSDFALFGFQVLSDLLNGRPWTESGHFPRVTLCDFEVRYLANLNRYTVQCALLINFLNEKVFAFFWCWYLILMCVTSFSFLFWSNNCMMSNEKIDYVLHYMEIAESSELKRESRMVNEARKPNRSSLNNSSTHPTKLVDDFVLNFLKSDGVFTLRLMANHAGDLLVMQDRIPTTIRLTRYAADSRCYISRSTEPIEANSTFQQQQQLNAPPPLPGSTLEEQRHPC